VRSNFVVLAPELLDGDLGIDSVSEPLHGQALVTELAIERLIRPVLPRLTRIDMRSVDVGLGEPLEYCPGHELRPVVGSQVLGAAMNTHQLAQHLDDSPRADIACHIDRQALTRKLIHDRQTLELLPVGAGIEHEVIGPHLAHGRCRQRPWAADCHAAPRPFSGHLQPMQAPKAVRTVSAHRVTASLEEHLDAPVPVARVLRRCRFHACRPGLPSQAGPAFHGMTGRGVAGR